VKSAIPDHPIRVAIVEDDRRVRHVLRDVLRSGAACECVGTFSNGTLAVEQIPGLRPDVILMDINLPDMTGVDCVREISPQLPDTQILMLTVYQDPDTIFKALAAGAHGYLLKPVMPEKLLEAICEVRAGGVPMSRTIARKVVGTFRQPASKEEALSNLSDEAGLAPREREVLNHLVAGLSYKEIAAELEISGSTVSTYVQRIYEKLHVRTRREIIARYQEGG
jgi:DNA-binding NarL/FixJ family response regulator